MAADGRVAVGIALRTGSMGLSVETWSYEAPFLPRGGIIPIVTPPHAAHLPLIFVIMSALPIRLQPPQEHRGKRRRVTRVTVSGRRVTDLEEAVATLCDPALVVFRQAPEHHLELDWDGATTGERRDFRPALPLTLRW